MAGFRLPIEAVALQALVSEPIKPCMDVVVMANTVHGYMSQSDKGEMVIGGGTDGFNNYTQRGSFHHIEETLRALVETFPIISRLKMLRQWGGIVDMTGDRSPIISKTPLGQLLHQLRLGHRRLQGHPGLGLGDGGTDGQGRTRAAGRGLQHVALQGRPVHRRVGGCRGGALMKRV
jgi:sarcosine oxidase subunit beta